MASPPHACDFGWKAPSFRLPSTDGRVLSFIDVAGPKGTLIMFLCNHCPYVLSALDRIIRDSHDLRALCIGAAAICSNDAAAYPEDSFPRLRDLASKHSFLFSVPA